MKLNSIITKHKADIGELKDIEISIAGNEKREAMLDYIIACDYPEVLEDDEEVMTNE